MYVYRPTTLNITLEIEGTEPSCYKYHTPCRYFVVALSDLQDYFTQFTKSFKMQFRMQVCCIVAADGNDSLTDDLSM